MSNKNTKNKSTKSAAAPAASAKSSKSNLFTRLANSRGRLVGVTTISNDRVRNMVGQIKSVSPSYATIADRTRGLTRFALRTVLTVRGV